MATHSSILAWRIPRIEEPSGPQSMGVTENWTRLSEHTHMVVASPGSEPEGRNPCGWRSRDAAQPGLSGD